MQSKAATVAEYLASLPTDRRTAIELVRSVILENLDRDYEESMQWGMISYYVPHRVFPAGYHCDPTQPLPFAALASQKNYMAVYLMANYVGGSEEGWFRKAWEKTGKKLDMGKCCVRFKSIDHVALDVIGEAVRRVPASKYIEFYQRSLASRAAEKASGAGPKKGAKSTRPKAARPKKSSAAKKPARAAKRSTKRSVRR